jgi:hypothetical protein
MSPPTWRFPFTDDANRRGGRGREAGSPSGFVENALDRDDCHPIDLGNLGNRQVRMRANCDLGISGAVCCWELSGASTSS